MSKTRNYQYLGMILGMLLPKFVFAHGDHSAPGALPPPPRGGSVAMLESKSKGGHDHEEEHDHDHKEKGHDEHEEGHDHKEVDDDHGHDHDEKTAAKKDKKVEEKKHDELFVEVTQKGKDVTVFLLSLADGAKMFKSTNIGDLKGAQLFVEFPRSMKNHTVALTAAQNKWTAILPDNKDRRFFATVMVEVGNEKKQARVHVEKTR